MSTAVEPTREGVEVRDLTSRRVRLDSLVEDPQNARLHDDRNLAGIAHSLQNFGQREPLVVRDGVVIGGNGRLRAMRELGWAECWVTDHSDLTEAQARALGVTLNRTAEIGTSWHAENLKLAIEACELECPEIVLDFKPVELAAIMPGSSGGSGGGSGGGAGSLAERFLVPPFSVLDARQGYWQDRQRAWLALGIKSEIGREGAPGGSPRPAAQRTASGHTARGDGRGRGFGQDEDSAAGSSGTSIFSPVLCELVYLWFSPVGGTVLDPFAGGSVRGIVASKLGRQYVGVELRAEQVAANREQENICTDPMPVWIEGDSRDIRALVGDVRADLVFSCPPYADLERYSDDPRDLSTLDYAEFVAAYRTIIAESCALLRDDRFACFVVGDVRDPKGNYRNFVSETIEAFAEAGLALYNEAILVTALGSLPIRVGKQFTSGRKLGKTHQNVLVFLKGDFTRAVEACGTVDVADVAEQFGEVVQ